MLETDYAVAESMPLPSLGRIVHFHEGGEVRPAIITFVHSKYMVNLTVFGFDSQASVLRTSMPWIGDRLTDPALPAGWFWPKRA